MNNIDALLEEKKPVKEIATRLGRSYKCLYKHINRNGVYQLFGGRPIALSVRTKRQIVREMTINANVTVPNLIKQFIIFCILKATNLPQL